MTHEEYLQEVLRTYAGSESPASQLTLGALGLAGESGEVIDLIKKHLYQGHPLDQDKLCDELGDVLWYLTLLARGSGSSLEEAMHRNVAKLRRRYPDGFETERSLSRTSS